MNLLLYALTLVKTINRTLRSNLITVKLSIFLKKGNLSDWGIPEKGWGSFFFEIWKNEALLNIWILNFHGKAVFYIFLGLVALKDYLSMFRIHFIENNLFYFPNCQNNDDYKWKSNKSLKAMHKRRLFSWTITYLRNSL